MVGSQAATLGLGGGLVRARPGVVFCLTRDGELGSLTVYSRAHRRSLLSASQEQGAEEGVVKVAKREQVHA